MRTRIVDDITTLDARRWNALCDDRQPFIAYEFLAALERTGCVTAATGWEPHHIVVEGDHGELLAATPLYLKDHSWGEFVFDFAWADAYHRSGLDYYPKLVGMSPFTPVTGKRLLAGADERARTALLDALDGAARTPGRSSLHILFATDSEAELLAGRGLTIREDCRFLWHNDSYASFDDFLGALRSSKRKEIRRERRRVADQGITVVTEVADTLDLRAWREVYAMIARTFVLRGHAPYMTLAFFRAVAGALGPRMLVNLARRRGRTIGAAIMFRDERVLYGRYWGAEAEYDCLHFETCYYRGIEYCIEHGLDRFDPGTQGEHKVRRGFTPVRTRSAHWIADARFRDAIDAWVAEERERVAEYMALAAAHLPYRRQR